MTSFESQVDKILEQLINEKLPIKATEIGWEKIGEDVADAKQALLNAHREEVIKELKQFHNWISSRPEYQNITLHTLQTYWDLYHKPSLLSEAAQLTTAGRGDGKLCFFCKTHVAHTEQQHERSLATPPHPDTKGKRGHMT